MQKLLKYISYIIQVYGISSIVKDLIYFTSFAKKLKKKIDYSRLCRICVGLRQSNAISRSRHRAKPNKDPTGR